ncbi:MAG: hypothetical protein LBR97_10475 [Dysgonamonadaceae bacterium]|jgi:hypothetical protein|nr:hypothetical protein [Dysgonamonadaceae bacterium]
MSRDFILDYAKGEASNPAYLIVYSVDGNKVVIRSCGVISGQKESVLIRKTYNDKETDVPESEVMQAAKKYMAASKQKL